MSSQNNEDGDSSNCQILNDCSENQKLQAAETDDIDIENSICPSVSQDDLGCHSRYGRIRKRKSLGPDMEFTPLVRKNKRSKSNELNSSLQPTLDKWFFKKTAANGIQETNLNENVVGCDKENLAAIKDSMEVNDDFNTNSFHYKTTGSPEITPTKHQRQPRIDSSLSGSGKKRGRPPKNQTKSTLSFAVCKVSSEISPENNCALEISSDNSLAKNKERNSSSVLDFMNSLECQLGDLLWSKVPGHPWWPCMVAYDPYLGIFIRDAKRKNAKVYHIQYFGSSAQRGWTADGRVMVFDGRKAFDDIRNQIAKLPKSQKHDQMLATFKIAPSKMPEWEIAVSEAEEALKMTREERIENLTFEYTSPSGERYIPGVTDISLTEVKTEERHVTEMSPTEVKTQKPINKIKIRNKGKEKLIENECEQQKPAAEISTAANGECNQVHNLNTEINLDENEKTEPNEKLSNGTKKTNSSEKTNGRHRSSLQYGTTSSQAKSNGSCFEVYLTRHLNEIINDHPEFSSKEAEGYLLYQWRNLSDVQKLRYSLKFDTEETNSFIGKTVTRERKPRRIQNNNVDRTSEVDTDFSETSSLRDDHENGEHCRHDKVCSICDVTGNVITCQGPCMQSYHRGCLGLTKAPPSYMCPECSSGKHKCFGCKLDDGEVKKCSVSSCGRYYHQSCLNKVALSTSSDTRIVCSLHTCLTCFNENSKSIRCRKGRMMRCIRCPSAYHTGEDCVSAGSISLTANHILCAKHFHPQKNNKFHSHLNATWCFICSEGGNLICCESCPAAFHPDCLNIVPPEGNYYCNDCSNEKHPCYGDIVWVKLGCYRWWPAEIQHPNSVPRNIQNLEHNVGEFPVRFFGSHDYFWTHMGRVFLFYEGDKGSKDTSSGRHLAQVFRRAVEEATEAFQKWKQVKSKVVHAESWKLPPYKHIKINRPVGKVQIPSVDPATLPSCECSLDTPNPCSNDAQCMNRILMFECHPNVCPAGEKCQNQRFQKREYPEAKPFKTEGRGWGLQAEQDIKKGDFVSEYVGELIDEEECEKRLQQLNEDDDSNFYFLTIEKDRIIDAGPKGNFSRFMNHSCQPNCETQKWTVNGDTRVGLFALCDIPKGTELTFNYNLDCRGNERLKCGCGSTICSGYIGLRPKTANAISQEKKIRESKGSKRKKKSLVRKHDDECYRCGEGGELMMCDQKTCTKSYHLNCLGLTKPSRGRWECPWHHCDICGNTSTMLCSYCPNSFCKVHATSENIRTEESGQIQCNEHEEEDGLHSPEENTS